MQRNTTLYYFPLFLALTIFALSGASRIATPDLNFAISKDKLAHFLIFGLLATSILRTPKLCHVGWKGALIAALITSGYGGFDELRQSLTPERSVEFADWIADTLGAAVAVIVYTRWHAYRRLLEWKPKLKKN
ncbi:MAG: VanZ family protein [Opitutaceae bacterium]